MSDTTIIEEFRLPSLGKVYSTPFDPTVKLRSMTTAEEMKRLSVVENQYQNMCEMIEDCLETKLPIPVYDLCLGDYQYLLNKLRVVTYGTDYHVTITCPFCGNIYEYVINLDDLKVHEYTDDFEESKRIILPKTGKTIDLRLQTPKTLDTIEKKRKQMKKDFPEMKEDPTLMLNLESVIRAIDGKPVNPATIQHFIKSLPMMDTNILLDAADKLNSKIGIDVVVKTACPECGNEALTPFRYTGEFFRPAVR